MAKSAKTTKKKVKVAKKKPVAKKKTKAKEPAFKPLKNYLVNPPCVQERVKYAYDAIKAIMDKWEPIEDGRDETNGNIQSHFIFDRKVGSFVQLNPDQYESFDPRFLAIYDVISSALLLYRLMCRWPMQVKTYGFEGYKFVWTSGLRHKETGEVLAFGEWKGGAGFYTKNSSIEDLPPPFIADMIELFNHLVDQKFQHPYDGTVAGSVA